MRAAGSGDGWRGQYLGAFDQLGVREIAGSAFGRHLPWPTPRAERMDERLEVLLQGTAGGWQGAVRAQAVPRPGLPPAPARSARRHRLGLRGRILAAGQCIVDNWARSAGKLLRDMRLSFTVTFA